jgi:hypothetical protein
VLHPLDGRRIPIITDKELVDMSFGTGAVKITPAHDPNDFATGKRHNLQFINILTNEGTINENGGQFAGQPRFEVCVHAPPFYSVSISSGVFLLAYTSVPIVCTMWPYAFLPYSSYLGFSASDNAAIAAFAASHRCEFPPLQLQVMLIRTDSDTVHRGIAVARAEINVCKDMCLGCRRARRWWSG